MKPGETVSARMPALMYDLFCALSCPTVRFGSHYEGWLAWALIVLALLVLTNWA
jgi:hypothetical protein